MMSNSVTTVTSQTNPLAYAKAIATLVGTVVTGLLGVYGPDTEVGKVLVIVSIVATAITTWVVPNALVVPATIEVDHEAQVAVEVDVDDDYEDDGLSYEESGG